MRLDCQIAFSQKKMCSIAAFATNKRGRYIEVVQKLNVWPAAEKNNLF